MRKLIVATLLVAAAGIAHAQETWEQLGLRPLTDQEDRALRRVLGGLERLLPVPDGKRWARIESDAMMEKEKRLGTLLGGTQMFGECEPAQGGCFPDDVSVQLNYAPKDANAKAQSAQKDLPDDPLEKLVVLAEEAQKASEAFGEQLVIAVNASGEPEYGECPDDPKPEETRPDFMYDRDEDEDDTGRTRDRFIFGARVCSGDMPLWPRVTMKTPLAPIRAIELVIEGPVEDVRKLAARIDRKAFAARLGAVR